MVRALSWCMTGSITFLKCLWACPPSVIPRTALVGYQIAVKFPSFWIWSRPSNLRISLLSKVISIRSDLVIIMVREKTSNIGNLLIAKYRRIPWISTVEATYLEVRMDHTGWAHLKGRVSSEYNKSWHDTRTRRLMAAVMFQDNRIEPHPPHLPHNLRSNSTHNISRKHSTNSLSNRFVHCFHLLSRRLYADNVN